MEVTRQHTAPPRLQDALTVLGTTRSHFDQYRRNAYRSGGRRGREHAGLIGAVSRSVLQQDAREEATRAAMRFADLDGDMPSDRSSAVVFEAIRTAWMDGYRAGYAYKAQRVEPTVDVLRENEKRAGHYVDGDGEDYWIPPKAAAREAERAIRAIHSGSDAMTSTGRDRMRQIAARDRLSRTDIQDIDGWFSRHKAYIPDHDPPPNPSNSWVSWKGWGGDPMREFARREARKIDAGEYDDERANPSTSERLRRVAEWVAASLTYDSAVLACEFGMRDKGYDVGDYVYFAPVSDVNAGPDWVVWCDPDIPDDLSESDLLNDWSPQVALSTRPIPNYFVLSRGWIPITEDAIRAHADAFIPHLYGETGWSVEFQDENKHTIVGPSTREGYREKRYQITRMGQDGEPFGHTSRDDLIDALMHGRATKVERVTIGDPELTLSARRNGAQSWSDRKGRTRSTRRTADRSQVKQASPGEYATRAKTESTQRDSTAATYKTIGTDIRESLGAVRVLDYGSGSGAGAAVLEDHGLDVDTYEPNAPEDVAVDFTTKADLEGRSYDAVVVCYVLNVVPQDERDAVVDHVKSLLKPGGRAYFVARTAHDVAGSSTGTTLTTRAERVFPNGSYQYGFAGGELRAYLEDLRGHHTVKTFSAGGTAAVLEAPRENAGYTIARFLLPTATEADRFLRANPTDAGEQFPALVRMYVQKQADGLDPAKVAALRAGLMELGTREEIGLRSDEVEAMLEYAPAVVDAIENNQYPGVKAAADRFGPGKLPEYRQPWRGEYSDTQLEEDVYGTGPTREVIDAMASAFDQWKDDVPAYGWNKSHSGPRWDPARRIRDAAGGAYRAWDPDWFGGPDITEPTKENIAAELRERVVDPAVRYTQQMTYIARSDLLDTSRDPEDVAREMRAVYLFLGGYLPLRAILEHQHGVEIGEKSRSVPSDVEWRSMADYSSVITGGVPLSKALEQRAQLEADIAEVNQERAEKRATEDEIGRRAAHDFARWYMDGGWTTHPSAFGRKLNDYNDEEAPQNIRLSVVDDYYGSDKELRIYDDSQPGASGRVKVYRPLNQRDTHFYDQILPLIMLERLYWAQKDAGADIGDPYIKARTEAQEVAPVDDITEFLRRTEQLATDYELGEITPTEEPAPETESGFDDDETEQAFNEIETAAAFAATWAEMADDITDWDAFSNAWNAWFSGTNYRLLVDEDASGYSVPEIIFPSGLTYRARLIHSFLEWGVRTVVYDLARIVTTLRALASSERVTMEDLEDWTGQQRTSGAQQGGLRSASDLLEDTDVPRVELNRADVYGWKTATDVDPSDLPEDDREHWTEVQELVRTLENAGKHDFAEAVANGYRGELWSKGNDDAYNIDFIRSRVQKQLRAEVEDTATIDRREAMQRGEPMDVEPDIRDVQYLREFINGSYSRISGVADALPDAWAYATVHAYNLVNAALAQLGVLPGDVDIPKHGERALRIKDTRKYIFGNARKLASHMNRVVSGWKNANPEKVEENEDRLLGQFEDVDSATEPFRPAGVPTSMQVLRQMQGGDDPGITFSASYYMDGPSDEPQRDGLRGPLANLSDARLAEQAQLAFRVIRDWTDTIQNLANIGSSKANDEITDAEKQRERFRDGKPLGDDVRNMPTYLQPPEGLRVILEIDGDPSAAVEIVEGIGIARENYTLRVRVLDALPDSPVREVLNTSSAPTWETRGAQPRAGAGIGWAELKGLEYLAGLRLPAGTVAEMQQYSNSEVLRQHIEGPATDTLSQVLVNLTGEYDPDTQRVLVRSFAGWTAQRDDYEFKDWRDAWQSWARSQLPALLRDEFYPEAAEYVESLSANRLTVGAIIDAGETPYAPDVVEPDQTIEQQTQTGETLEEKDDDDLADADIDIEQETEEDAAQAQEVAAEADARNERFGMDRREIQDLRAYVKEKLEEGHGDAQEVLQLEPVVDAVATWAFQASSDIAGAARREWAQIQREHDLGRYQEREQQGQWAKRWSYRMQVDVGLEPEPIWTPERLRKHVNDQYTIGDRGDDIPQDIAGLIERTTRVLWKYQRTYRDASRWAGTGLEYDYAPRLVSLAQKLGSRVHKLNRGDDNASRAKVAETRRDIIDVCDGVRRKLQLDASDLLMQPFLEELPTAEPTDQDIPSEVEEGTAVLRDVVQWINGNQDPLRERLARYEQRVLDDGSSPDVARSLAANTAVHAASNAPRGTDVQTEINTALTEGAKPYGNVIADIMGVKVSVLQALDATDLRVYLDDAQEGDGSETADPATDPETKQKEGPDPSAFLKMAMLEAVDPTTFTVPDTPWGMVLDDELQEWRVTFSGEETFLLGDTPKDALAAITRHRQTFGDVKPGTERETAEGYDEDAPSSRTFDNEQAVRVPVDEGIFTEYDDYNWPLLADESVSVHPRSGFSDPVILAWAVWRRRELLKRIAAAQDVDVPTTAEDRSSFARAARSVKGQRVERLTKRLDALDAFIRETLPDYDVEGNEIDYGDAVMRRLLERGKVPPLASEKWGTGAALIQGFDPESEPLDLDRIFEEEEEKGEPTAEAQEEERAEPEPEPEPEDVTDYATDQAAREREAINIGWRFVEWYAGQGWATHGATIARKLREYNDKLHAYSKRTGEPEWDIRVKGGFGGKSFRVTYIEPNGTKHVAWRFNTPDYQYVISRIANRYRLERRADLYRAEGLIPPFEPEDRVTENLLSRYPKGTDVAQVVEDTQKQVERPLSDAEISQAQEEQRRLQAQERREQVEQGSEERDDFHRFTSLPSVEEAEPVWDMVWLLADAFTGPRSRDEIDTPDLMERYKNRFMEQGAPDKEAERGATRVALHALAYSPVDVWEDNEKIARTVYTSDGVWPTDVIRWVYDVQDVTTDSVEFDEGLRAFFDTVPEGVQAYDYQETDPRDAPVIGEAITFDWDRLAASAGTSMTARDAARYVRGAMEDGTVMTTPDLVTEVWGQDHGYTFGDDHYTAVSQLLYSMPNVVKAGAGQAYRWKWDPDADTRTAEERRPKYDPEHTGRFRSGPDPEDVRPLDDSLQEVRAAATVVWSGEGEPPERLSPGWNADRLRIRVESETAKSSRWGETLQAPSLHIDGRAPDVAAALQWLVNNQNEEWLSVTWLTVSSPDVNPPLGGRDPRELILNDGSRDSRLTLPQAIEWLEDGAREYLEDEAGDDVETPEADDTDDVSASTHSVDTNKEVKEYIQQSDIVRITGELETEDGALFRADGNLVRDTDHRYYFKIGGRPERVKLTGDGPWTVDVLSMAGDADDEPTSQAEQVEDTRQTFEMGTIGRIRPGYYRLGATDWTIEKRDGEWFTQYQDREQTAYSTLRDAKEDLREYLRTLQPGAQGYADLILRGYGSVPDADMLTSDDTEPGTGPSAGKYIRVTGTPWTMLREGSRVVDSVQVLYDGEPTEWPTSNNWAEALEQISRYRTIYGDKPPIIGEWPPEPDPSKDAPTPEAQEVDEEKPAPPTSRVDVMDVQIENIHTDEDRFQPRAKAYSEATATRIAEDFDPNLMDPVDLWRDPEDGKLYMLAGHSRLEGMKRRGADSIPAQIRDFSEEDAIEYALIENDKGTNLTNSERADVIRTLRETGKLDTITEQRDYAQDLYDRNATLVFDLSWLSPTGKAISTLQSLEGSSGADYREAETLAQWVGKMMRLHRDDFRSRHENEMFSYLLDNYKDVGRGFSSFPEFRQYVEEAKSRSSDVGAFGGFDPETPLNLAQVRPQSRQEQRIDEEVQKAREAVKEARKELETRRRELLERGASQEDLDRILPPLERTLQRTQQDLIKLEQGAEEAKKEARQSQSDLFAAARANPGQTPVSLIHIGRVSKLSAQGPEGRISWACGSELSHMYMTPRGDALLIVPAQYVTVTDAQAPDDDADEAWEEWHHMKPMGGDHEIQVPSGPGVDVGTALRINYESDKIIEPGDRRGKQNRYFHDFTEGAHAVREYEMPQGVTLTVGGTLGAFDGLAVLESEGGLEIDGRGILN